ncbi:MAG: hypothetical protein M1835_003688 [Candelina submexicana]|nr:MAG: hypothetical protein M1835_003688 [Candelina submexicana]
MVKIALRRTSSEIFRSSYHDWDPAYNTDKAIHKSTSAPPTSLQPRDRQNPDHAVETSAPFEEMALAEVQYRPVHRLRITTSASNSSLSSSNSSPVYDHGSRHTIKTPTPHSWFDLSATYSSYFSQSTARDRILPKSKRFTADEESNHALAPPPPMKLSGSTAGLVDDGNYGKDIVNDVGCEAFSLPHRTSRTREPSITFNQQVTLDSGQQRALEEPLPRSEFKNQPRGRSILQELSDNASNKQQQAQGLETRAPGPPSPINTHIDPTYEPVVSLTSDSTTSAVDVGVGTPLESSTDFVLSPLAEYSPVPSTKSLEESNAWPIRRRRESGRRIASYNSDRQGSLRRSWRTSSMRSSPSSSMSPASAFLSKWGKIETPVAVEPDDEGQEVGDYVLGRQLGFGGFSVVKEAYTIEHGRRVGRAVKIVRKQVGGKGDYENEQLQAEFEHEVGLWRCLHHPRILPLIAVYDTDFATFCFTKSISGGSLFDLILSNRKGLRPELVRKYTYQLASAIRYLHEDVHVVHRDVKLENCLLDMSAANAATAGGNILLCDFGMAEWVNDDTRSGSPDPYEDAADRPPPKSIGPSETSTSIKGSLDYASPEVILNSSTLYSRPVDMWAFGVVAYTLLVGSRPFRHEYQPKMVDQILRGDWDRAALRSSKGAQGMTDEIMEVVEGCLAMNPEARWTVAQVLESRWLQGCWQMLDEIEDGWTL